LLHIARKIFEEGLVESSDAGGFSKLVFNFPSEGMPNSMGA
jgi:hypothetical protein